MKPTIVVAGFGRCGSSLVMQMLHAGGVPCAGRYPAFECPETSVEVTPEFIAVNAGRAVKILDPQRVGIPGNVRIIWLDRDTREQAKSHAKFARLMFGAHYDREQRRRLEGALALDRRDVMRRFGPPLWAGAPQRPPMMASSFESILQWPRGEAMRIFSFIGMPLDIERAASIVRERSPRCAEGLDMELSLLEAAGGLEVLTE